MPGVELTSLTLFNCQVMDEALWVWYKQYEVFSLRVLLYYPLLWIFTCMQYMEPPFKCHCTFHSLISSLKCWVPLHSLSWHGHLCCCLPLQSCNSGDLWRLIEMPQCSAYLQTCTQFDNSGLSMDYARVLGIYRLCLTLEHEKEIDLWYSTINCMQHRDSGMQ